MFYLAVNFLPHMKQLTIIALLAFCLASCGDDKKDNNDNASASGLDFSSYIRYDVNANQLELVGNTNDEYKQEEWPDWVWNLFSPLDSVNRTGLEDNPIVSVRALYPNSCRDTQALKLFSSKPVNLKIAIIDNQKTVYYLRSFMLPFSDQPVSLKYNSLLMPGGRNYRLFFGFSTENQPFFERGHIDIAKDL